MRVVDDRILFNWTRDENGGLIEKYELWYRSKTRTDYEWASIFVNNTFYNTSMENIIANTNSVFCSVRAVNSEGYSGFSYVVEVLSLSARNSEYQILKELSGEYFCLL